MRRLLLDGATGALGGPLARVLTRMSDVDLTVLVRNTHTRDSLISLYGSDNFHMIVGDVSKPFCDVTIDRPRKFDLYIHLAADTHYYGTFAINVSGTVNALELARRWDIPQFAEGSTAYVAGKDESITEDDLGGDSGHWNDYEASKAAAERIVLEYYPDALILRPTTVIGDSRTGETIGIGGYSAFTKVGWGGQHIIRKFPSKPMFFGINESGDLNLITRDWVIDHMIGAMLAEVRGVIHLSHPNPVNLGFLFRETFQKGLKLPVSCDPRVLDIDVGTSRDWKHVQQRVYQTIAYFMPYVTRNVKFGHERLKKYPWYYPPPEIDANILRIQMRYMFDKLFPQHYPKDYERIKQAA